MNKQEEKKSSSVAIVILSLLVCVVGVLIGYIIITASKDIETKEQTNELSSLVPSADPNTTLQPTRVPVIPESGEVLEGFISEDFESSLTVSSSSRYDSYVVLEYSNRSGQEGQGGFQGLRAYLESKYYSFYVRASDTVTVTVPSGIAKIYYVSGKTWYGKGSKFGEDTLYYTCDDEFDFEENTYDITLYPVSDGDMYTYEIDSDDFPT